MIDAFAGVCLQEHINRAKEVNKNVNKEGKGTFGLALCKVKHAQGTHGESETNHSRNGTGSVGKRLWNGYLAKFYIFHTK